jgi:NADPH-dependent 2,4-dienoyl-CoA reductase/sulfur reductase-like enzyme
MKLLNRRETLALSTAAVSGVFLAAPALAVGRAKVVIVGGGFGGASAARTLRQVDPDIDVTLITEAAKFTTCPFSNLVIAGERPLETITFGYSALAAQGIEVIIGLASGIEPAARLVRMQDGSTVAYDRLVVSPGIDLKYDAVPGYSKDLETVMPHAWKAGQQTVLLRDQLTAMPQGGTVLISVPDNPYRCPPGPYERASLMAYYLSRNNPTAKIIIIDGKDTFSKQSLFTKAWDALYPGMVSFVPFASNGGIVNVDGAQMTIVTAFESFRGDVINFIPPQKAPQFLLEAGLGGDAEWCGINQATFESSFVPGVHVLGDAAIVGDMPKSGFSAAVQGAVCAHVLAALLRDQSPNRGTLLNTCYSFVSPTYGISIAGVYRVTEEGRLKSVEGAGGTSVADAPPEVRATEADHARSWYDNLTTHLFG